MIRFTRGEDGSCPFLSEELQALMLFPADPLMRESARATLILQRVAKQSDSRVEVDASMIRSALAGVGIDALRQAMKERTIRGQVAGNVLRGLRAMRARGEAPSVSACVRELETELAVYETFGGERKGYGDRSIRSAWSEYKPVAHYWATANLLFERLTDTAESSDLASAVIGGAYWAHVMSTATASVIAGALAMLEQAAEIQLHDKKGRVPLFGPDEPWIPSEDYLLGVRPGKV